MGIAFASQLVKGNFLDAEVVLGGNLLGRSKVKPGLGLARVGDGGSADFKVAFGRRQLFAYSRFLGLDKGQAVLCGQHVKVSLADTHDQILIGSGQLGLGEIDLFETLLVTRPVAWPVQRL